MRSKAFVTDPLSLIDARSVTAIEAIRGVAITLIISISNVRQKVASLFDGGLIGVL